MQRKHHVLLMILLPFQSMIAQNCDHLSGIWKNELGSVLAIDSIDHDRGIIHGEYRSSSGVDGKVFPLQGWINWGEKKQVPSISFTVRWTGYGSITSWSGYCDQDKMGPFIKTLWHLVRPDTEHSWERVISNSSVFRPGDD